MHVLSAFSVAKIVMYLLLLTFRNFGHPRDTFVSLFVSNQYLATFISKAVHVLRGWHCVFIIRQSEQSYMYCTFILIGLCDGCVFASTLVRFQTGP